MTDDNPYGYDPKTDTVRVRRHDLARLLLEFRANLEHHGMPGAWSHMRDYDQSFERLADAVDAADATRGLDRGRDLRMRCNRTDRVYEWPDHAPYDGGPLAVVSVKGYGSHYVPWPDHTWPRALCEFAFAPEEGKRITGVPTCLECVREFELVAALGDETAQPSA